MQFRKQILLGILVLGVSASFNQQVNAAKNKNVPITEQKKETKKVKTKKTAISKNFLGKVIVYQANTKTESIANNYIKKTVAITKLNNKYRVKLTFLTPQEMGAQPITLLSDSKKKHAATKISTGKQIGNKYATTYQIVLQKKEFNQLIPMKIHVKFSKPIQYNENYDIRLAITSNKINK